MLASIIFATVALIAGINAHPRRAQAEPTGSDAKTMVQCKYWVDTEKCLHHNMRKYKSEMDYEKDVHINHHHMMKPDHEKYKPCNNGDDWWVKCPSSPHEWDEMCNSLEADHDKTMLKNCRYSCQQCGEDAFLTAPKEYMNEPSDLCAEFSHHSSFHCVKKSAEMKIKPNFITALYVPSVNSADCDSTTVNYCVEFDYRRRGSDHQNEQAAYFTKFAICEQNSAVHEYDVIHEDIRPTCHDDMGVLLPGAKEYAKSDNCVFGKWFRATYQFTPISSDCDHKRRIILEIERGVDFFDVDNFYVYEGICQVNEENATDVEILVELIKKDEE